MLLIKEGKVIRMNNTNQEPGTLLDVKINKGVKTINYSGIEYCKGNNKNVIVYFIDGKVLDTRELLSWYNEKLPQPLFCRCHSSFIVNCANIHCVNGNKFLLNSDLIIPISDKYKESALATYKQYVQQSGK